MTLSALREALSMTKARLAEAIDKVKAVSQEVGDANAKHAKPRQKFAQETKTEYGKNGRNPK